MQKNMMAIEMNTAWLKLIWDMLKNCLVLLKNIFLEIVMIFWGMI